MKKALYSKLPVWTKYLLVISEGWLVGSAIGSTIHDKEVKDYDIIVEDPELYQRAVQYLTGSGFQVTVNTFGGLKFIKDNIVVDIWIESVGHFILNRRKNQDSPVYNLKRSVFLNPQE